MLDFDITHEIARSQLDRVLSFFPRVEGKASFLFAINVGMLAVAFTNLDYVDVSTWFIMVPLVAALICSAFAIFNVGTVVRPDLYGGKDSVIYFGSIANMGEKEFVDKFKACDTEEAVNEILKQVHRNSEILKEKFVSVSRSLFWTTISTVPWSVYLIISSVYHSKIVEVTP